MYKVQKLVGIQSKGKTTRKDLSDFSAADPNDSQVSRCPCLPVGVKIELALETTHP